MWSALVGLILALLFLVAVICAFRAATTARTPQGAVGWVVFLLAAPHLGVPLYLFLGHHRYKGYLVARRQTEQVIEGIHEFGEQHAPAAGSISMPVHPFENSAGMPVVRGNGVDILIDGPAAFNAIFAAIDAAKNYVLVQFYIVRDDELGQALQARLIAAAQRGVTVRLMTDAVGSHGLPESYFSPLRTAGVHLVDHRATHGPKSRFQINLRNHRKTVITDGTTAFTGGLNVGDEYMGRDPNFGRWRDTHIQLSGPMVSQLQLIFAEDWHWATEEVLLDHLNWTVPDSEKDLSGLIVATGPGDLTETGSLMFFSAIVAAKERCWIASPYFVPDIDIMTALRHAALRGVDVRILVPDVIDHHIPWLAAFSYFDDVRQAGVKIFRYTDGFMHQKAFVIDDTLAAIGTTNLDNRSFRLNFEAMALFFDADVTARVDAMFRADFEQSFELTKTIDQQPARIRHGAPLARLFSPLL